jgi:hypothetical protein
MVLSEPPSPDDDSLNTGIPSTLQHSQQRPSATSTSSSQCQQ